MIALTSATGLGRLLFQIQQKESPAEAALYQYLRAHRQPGQLYAVPPKMQEFRLATGLPILADFKSIPYAGGEVLEWYQRVRLLQWFYRDQVEFIDCTLLEDFAGYGLTHVVLGPEQLELNCPQLQEVYRKDQFAVHRLTDP
jgi:hypothetical protein